MFAFWATFRLKFYNGAMPLWKTKDHKKCERNENIEQIGKQRGNE